MADPLTFLTVDDNADARSLLVRTLMRKFPGSACVECEDGEAAVAIARKTPLAAAIVHRAADADAIPLVIMLKAVTAAPVIVVSGIDRSKAAHAAGAAAFLHYDAWLRIGTVVEECMRGPADPPPS